MGFGVLGLESWGFRVGFGVQGSGAIRFVQALVQDREGVFQSSWDTRRGVHYCCDELRESEDICRRVPTPPPQHNWGTLGLY